MRARVASDVNAFALGVALFAAAGSLSSCSSPGSASGAVGSGGSVGGSASGTGGGSPGTAGQATGPNGGTHGSGTGGLGGAEGLAGGGGETGAITGIGGEGAGSGGRGGIIDSGGTGGAAGAAGSSSGGPGGAGASGATAGAGAAGGASGAAGTAGGSGGASLPAGPFPTQACLDRASALVAQMTVTEKYAQMMQIERAALTPAQVTQYGIGSVYSQGGSAPTPSTPTGWADMTDGYRQAALASRLKIPIIYGADEVHGIGTVPGAVVFPHNVGLGATRDVALVKQVAQITAAEAQGTGVDFLFGPVVAVARDERWGRTYEAFGETTDLAQTMGVAMTQGIQLTASGAPTGILANAKHYLGDGGTANGANGGLTAGDETTLRAIHLEPYRSVVAAHVGSIMASYNSWQGTKMHINGPMITGVLKGQLGFGGFVGSDFDACFQLGLPNTAAGQQDGLGQCINAGVDMFMLFRVNIATTLGFFTALTQAGTVTPARIDDAVRRILAVKCEMGLFTSTGKVDRTLTAQVGSADHRMVARQAVRESLVVVKNDGNVLPLSKTAHVALGGKSADNTGNQCGGWTITWQGSTGNVVPGATSVRQAFESVLGTAGVTYSATAPSATGATVGVAVIGETPYAEGMGDRTSLALAAADVSVVQAMKQAGLETVVVLIAGRPMLLDTILPYADAIVVAWLPGSEGAGITDVLFGDAHPTGKLPHSWPKTMAQIPINQGDTTYDPLYPFGFGLTY